MYGSSRSGSVASTVCSTACGFDLAVGERDQRAFERRRRSRVRPRLRPRAMRTKNSSISSRDHRAEQLVLAAGKLAVHRGPRHPRFTRDVLDRDLGEPVPRDARVRGGDEHADAEVRRSPPPAPAPQIQASQSPSSVSSPTVRPAFSRTARIASSTPGMNDDRSYESWRIDSD